MVSKKRNGKAVISFHSATDAVCLYLEKEFSGSQFTILLNFGICVCKKIKSVQLEALNNLLFLQSQALESECGLKDNPLQLVWASGKPSATVSSKTVSNKAADLGKVSLDLGDDYEAITLMRLRQAQERKRLAEEIQKEEEKDLTVEEKGQEKGHTVEENTAETKDNYTA